MFPTVCANNAGSSCVALSSVEIPGHPLSRQKLEQIVLRILNRSNPLVAPSPAPWIVFAISEMFFIGTLELIEVELALKYDIGLGSGGLPLDVYRRPITFRAAEIEPPPNLTYSVSDSSSSSSDDDDVQILPTKERTIVDLTGYPDGDESLRGPKRKRKLKRITRAQKRQRREEQAASTTDDQEEQEHEFWIDLMETDDDENFFMGNESDPKSPSPAPDYWILSDSDDPPITSLRVGIFCPRPFRSRLLNAIMNAMDNLPIGKPCPQFKRNGFYLDILWFLGANEYSTLWMITTVEKLSKKKIWRTVGIQIEPWSNKFVVRNVLQLVLPWKHYPGNKKGKVIRRLRKANLMHGSNLWNLIGIKLDMLKVQVTLAVNEETMESLKRTQFYVFYGFSQYRCEVIKTSLK